MYLTDDEKEMHDGHLGEAVSMAMSILVDLGEAIDAPEMVEITHVHTDSGFYLGDAGLEFVGHLAALGGQVAVPTSMNHTSFYIFSQAGYKVAYESIRECVESAVAGKILRRPPAWLQSQNADPWLRATAAAKSSPPGKILVFGAGSTRQPV